RANAVLALLHDGGGEANNREGRQPGIQADLDLYQWGVQPQLGTAGNSSNRHSLPWLSRKNFVGRSLSQPPLDGTRAPFTTRERSRSAAPSPHNQCGPGSPPAAGAPATPLPSMAATFRSSSSSL